MTYEYKCVKCEHVFDVMKSVADFDRNEFCEPCGAPAERLFSRRVHITGARVEHAEYNPGLGCVTKNKRHRDEIARSLGLTEIGNDYRAPDRQHDENAKTREERRERRYREALDE